MANSTEHSTEQLNFQEEEQNPLFEYISRLLEIIEQYQPYQQSESSQEALSSEKLHKIMDQLLRIESAQQTSESNAVAIAEVKEDTKYLRGEIESIQEKIVSMKDIITYKNQCELAKERSRNEKIHREKLINLWKVMPGTIAEKIVHLDVGWLVLISSNGSRVNKELVEYIVLKSQIECARGTTEIPVSDVVRFLRDSLDYNDKLAEELEVILGQINK